METAGPGTFTIIYRNLPKLDYFGYTSNNKATQGSDRALPRTQRSPANPRSFRNSMILPPSPLPDDIGPEAIKISHRRTPSSLGFSLSLPSPPVTPFAPPFNLYSSSTPPAQTPRPSAESSKTATVIPARVLMIDDNPINLQILARLLKIYMSHAIGHMETADNGIKALEILAHHPFDLVLMDIDMPIMNGIDTTHHIRHPTHHPILPSNRGTPIVAVTTNDSAEWQRTYTRIGMNGCIGKPISPSALRETLNCVLELDRPHFTP
ncbi:CheY-like superfamily [Phycomyces blakesleeanus]